MNIGKNILTLRKSKTLTQDNLADELKVSRQAISKWELGSSKPDIENIIKLSKMFKISIDELVNNEIIKTEALSIKVKQDDKKVNILLWIRRIMVVLAIIFVINTIYKFLILFKITNVEKQYKELNNYHYVITTYNGSSISEEEESWYKDGMLKTINTKYINNQKYTTSLSIDYNNEVVYVKDEQTQMVQDFDLNDYILKGDSSKMGEQLYDAFPKELRSDNLFNTFFNSSSNFKIGIKEYENHLALDIGNLYISLDKKSLLPILVHCENKINSSLETKQYLIELNSVESIKI